MTPEQIDVELTLLREFYHAWVSLHSTPRDAMHRKQMETKAQLLVERGHAVAAYRQSYPENADA